MCLSISTHSHTQFTATHWGSIYWQSDLRTLLNHTRTPLFVTLDPWQFLSQLQPSLDSTKQSRDWGWRVWGCERYMSGTSYLHQHGGESLVKYGDCVAQGVTKTDVRYLRERSHKWVLQQTVLSLLSSTHITPTNWEIGIQILPSTNALNSFKTN